MYSSYACIYAKEIATQQKRWSYVNELKYIKEAIWHIMCVFARNTRPKRSTNKVTTPYTRSLAFTDVMKSTKVQTLGAKRASCSIAVCWAVRHRRSQ